MEEDTGVGAGFQKASSQSRAIDKTVSKLTTRAAPPRLGVPILAPIAFLVTLTLGLTVMAGPVSRLTMQAAEQLLDANHYV